MKKIMAMVLDTETCPIDRTMKSVDPYNMLTYDIGYSIVDLHRNVYLERSFVLVNTFFGEEEKMKSGYYAKKLPQYKLDMANGKRLPRTWEEISEIMRNDIKEYGITIIVAHNARFDYGTLRKTQEWFNKDYLLPYGLEWWDTMKMVKSTIATQNKYKKFCLENNYMTKEKTPKPQTKAEVVYRFLTNNNNFEENHTGLEDVKIEREIMWACFDKHKKMTRKLWND